MLRPEGAVRNRTGCLMSASSKGWQAEKTVNLRWKLSLEFQVFL